MQLTILGTSHIARESLNKVKEVINKGNYDIVALELDSPRLHALLHKSNSRVRVKDILKIGVKGYFFGIFGAWAERRLGEMVGVKPGAEMLAAYKLAKKKDMQIALIDQRIDVTLKKFSQNFTWREKWTLFADLAKSIVKREKIGFNLSKVPPKEVIQKLTKNVKERYPNLYRVLVTERNKVMADNLTRLIKSNPEKKIVAIVGAGHEEELMRLVKQNIEADAEMDISYGFTIG